MNVKSVVQMKYRKKHLVYIFKNTFIYRIISYLLIYMNLFNINFK